MGKKIFVDESGDLGLRGSNYFIITAFIIDEENYKKLEHIIKNARKRKFKKKQRKMRELKGYLLDKELVFYFFNKLNRIDYQTRSIAMDKNYHKNIEGIKDHNTIEIYLKMLTELLNNINLENRFELIIDKFLRARIEKILNTGLLNGLSENIPEPKIWHEASEKHIGLQFTDLIAWSVYQYLEKNNLEFIEKVLNNHEIAIFTMQDIKMQD